MRTHLNIFCFANSLAVLCDIALVSCLAGSWRSYFSLVVVDACKPRFLAAGTQQVRLAGETSRLSQFGSQAAILADLFTGSVTNLAGYPLHHRYRRYNGKGRYLILPSRFVAAPARLPHETSAVQSEAALQSGKRATN